MKSLKKVTLLVLTVVMANAGIVLASHAGSSDAKVSVRQIKSEQKKAIIQITNLPAGQAAVLRIKDKQGYVVYSEVIKQREDFARKYDFSKLSGENYTVELRTRDGIITESFALEAGHTNPMYFKPVVQQEPGLIKVAFFNRMSSPVALKLYDQGGRVVYEETVPSQKEFVKGLNISRLRDRRYSLTLLGHNYVYSKSIPVK